MGVEALGAEMGTLQTITPGPNHWSVEEGRNVMRDQMGFSA